MEGPAKPYEAIEPYDAGMLEVGDGHSLYYEQCGHRDGKPALFLHGGPGAGAMRFHRRLWDPKAYRIVLYDQRGAGKSRPRGALAHNTTDHLVEDIERLLRHLSIDRVQLVGGSWGATLALAYAQRYPQRVSEIILRGVFTMRRTELDWFFGGGAARIFPDAWERFLEPIPAEERGDPVRAYHRLLCSDDASLRARAATSYLAWEQATSRLRGEAPSPSGGSAAESSVAFARIESHYVIHGGFFERDDAILHEMPALAAIPGVLVHGRYDVICPAENAWIVHRRWPASTLEIIEGAGHSLFEPAILKKVIEATDRFRP